MSDEDTPIGPPFEGILIEKDTSLIIPDKLGISGMIHNSTNSDITVSFSWHVTEEPDNDR